MKNNGVIISSIVCCVFELIVFVICMSQFWSYDIHQNKYKEYISERYDSEIQYPMPSGLPLYDGVTENVYKLYLKGKYKEEWDTKWNYHLWVNYYYGGFSYDSKLTSDSL